MRITCCGNLACHSFPQQILIECLSMPDNASAAPVLMVILAEAWKMFGVLIKKNSYNFKIISFPLC